MTGPDHYREAERLLASLQLMESGAGTELPTIAEAQVHATLAQAAAFGTAIAVQSLDEHDDQGAAREWLLAFTGKDKED